MGKRVSANNNKRVSASKKPLSVALVAVAVASAALVAAAQGTQGPLPLQPAKERGGLHAKLAHGGELGATKHNQERKP